MIEINQLDDGTENERLREPVFAVTTENLYQLIRASLTQRQRVLAAFVRCVANQEGAIRRVHQFFVHLLSEIAKNTRLVSAPKR